MKWVLAAEIAAFWPVWIWYARRLGDSPEEYWGVAAFATALWIGRGPGKGGVAGPALLVAAYAAAYPHLLPIFRAALAVAAVGWTATGAWSPGIAGLWTLSVPLAASLQFYAGYPLRVAAAHVAAGLAGAAGIEVGVEGTLLHYGRQLVEVDAPCSGVRMLWASLYLAFMWSAVHRFSAARTAATALVAATLAVGANALRASALFYPEAGLVKAPEWMHAAAGVAAFVPAVLMLRRWVTWNSVKS